MKVEHSQNTVLYSVIQCYTVCVGMNNSCPTMLATGIFFSSVTVIRKDY